MTQRKKNNIIIGSLCAVVLLMAVGYAAFSSILNIKGTSSISSNWKVLITNVVSKNIVGSATNAEEPSWEDLTATFKTNLVSPGDSIEYDITIENRGNLNATLDKITLSDSNNEAIKFTSSGLEEGTELNAGGTATLTVKVEYDSNVTSQPENTEGTFTVTLDYSQKEGGVPSTPITSTDLTANTVETGDGLYTDDYNSGRYVYKGANPANYITFNNELWRILSVESDGSLKIIKNESIGSMQWDSTGVNNWARPADLNTYLNNDYYNSLDANFRDLVISHNFGIGKVDKYGEASYNFTSQIKAENSEVWDGKVALITLGDFMNANSNKETCYSLSNISMQDRVCKTSNYILSLISGDYFILTLTPDNSTHSVHRITNSGGTLEYNVTVSEMVFPVLYLKSGLSLTGDGSQGNPYTIN